MEHFAPEQETIEFQLTWVKLKMSFCKILSTSNFIFSYFVKINKCWQHWHNNFLIILYTIIQWVNFFSAWMSCIQCHMPWASTASDINRPLSIAETYDRNAWNPTKIAIFAVFYFHLKIYAYSMGIIIA